MRSKRLRVAAVGALMVLAAAVAGCGGNSGNSASDLAVQQSRATANDWPVAGATAATTGPNGPRIGVPDAPLSADNGDGGEMDRLALNTLADLKDYWAAEYAKNFPGKFAPVSKFISWDSTAPQDKSVTFCRSSTYQVVNAAYCSVDDTIGWDRGTLLPLVANKYGKMAVVMVLAHEYGHSIQHMARLNGFLTPGIVLEQQADCFAGVFLHHVADNGAAHFTLNTTDGLNGVLGATVAVRDHDPNNPNNVHGSAFERVTAVQIGWTDGAAGCKTINKKEIQQRRGGLPTTFEDGAKQDQEPVDEGGLEAVKKALSKLYPLPAGPNVVYTGIPKNCPKDTSTEPVSYCPANDTLGVDVPELAKRAGKQPGDHDPLSAVVDGNYNAFLPFISRYMLAVEKNRKQSLTGAATAGLRTVCLAGVVTDKLADKNSSPRLDAGDLDAAVSGLLADGIAAGDVDGKVVPTGYDRLEAFRTGVLDGESACQSHYA
ncbi:neutral zinc metallopeptidase [Nocardia stercoris]|uniref:Metallopeptidase n=1 Tax=Nocardia stercoris TaxID=2483361 RepID=A0A3M2KWV2_9NOCA|nr:metallopeptidase [Nocardia stercoris]RMI27975.1 metallopeptidase [Nocardia stercoris]